MLFYRKYSLIGIIIIVVSYFVFIKRYLLSFDYLIIGLCVFGIVYALSYYKLKAGVIYKYYLFIRLRSIPIHDIIMIEAVTVEQIGKAYVYIGKHSKHSGYYLCLRDGTKYKLHRDYTNNNWTELGIYLSKNHCVRIKEIVKSKVTNDWF